MRRTQSWPPLAAIAVGLWLCWSYGYQCLWTRLNTDVHGVVVASDPVDETTRDPRWIYTIRTRGGGEVRYVARLSMGSLQLGLPVGSRVQKNRWQLDYAVDGRRVVFPTNFFVIVTFIGVLAVVGGTFFLVIERLGSW